MITWRGQCIERRFVLPALSERRGVTTWEAPGLIRRQKQEQGEGTGQSLKWGFCKVEQSKQFRIGYFD